MSKSAKEYTIADFQKEFVPTKGIMPVLKNVMINDGHAYATDLKYIAILDMDTTAANGLYSNCLYDNFIESDLSKDTFPSINLHTPKITIQVDKNLLSNITKCMSNDYLRYYLCGACIDTTLEDTHNKQACLVSCNGHILNKSKCNVAFADDIIKGRFIIPAGFVNCAKKHNAREIHICDTYCSFKSDCLYVQYKLIDGTYPDYTRIIPTGYSDLLEFDISVYKNIKGNKKDFIAVHVHKDNTTHLSVNEQCVAGCVGESVVAYSLNYLRAYFNNKVKLYVDSKTPCKSPAISKDGCFVIYPVRGI